CAGRGNRAAARATSSRRSARAGPAVEVRQRACTSTTTSTAIASSTHVRRRRSHPFIGRRTLPDANPKARASPARAGEALFGPSGTPPGSLCPDGGPPESLGAHRFGLGLRQRLLKGPSDDLVLLEQAAEVAAVDTGGTRGAGDVVPALLQQRREVPPLERPHRQAFGLGIRQVGEAQHLDVPAAARRLTELLRPGPPRP